MASSSYASLTPLVRSILQDQTGTKLQVCLARGESPDQLLNFNGSQLSPLHLACITGNVEAANLLIRSSKCQSVVVNRQSNQGESPLYVASAYGHARLVSCLIRSGADVDLPQKLGCTPLWAAAQNGHRAVVKLLIEAQADVNLPRNEVGSTPLYIAAQNGHEEVVSLLVSSMSDVDSQKADGCTPLYIAAQKGQAPVVAALLKAQADPDRQQDRGRTPVFAAAQAGHWEVARLLTRSGADVNIRQMEGASPLLISAQFGFSEIVDCIVKHGAADVNLPEPNGATPVYIASQEGHARIVRDLVRAMADVNQAMSNGSTPLHTAVQNGHYKVVQELIRSTAEVNPSTDYRFSAVYAACALGYPSLAECLLKSGAQPNLDYDLSEVQPLHVAAQCNNLAAVTSLINAQADVNRLGRLGTTALYTAAQENNFEAASILLEAGADPDATGHCQGAAPIHIASQLGQDRIVHLLAARSMADVNLQLSNGCTALYLASQLGRTMSLRILLSVPQIDVDLRNSSGCSPLYAASQEGHTRVVDYLLAAGAEVNLRACDGTSALWTAAQSGHRPIADRLIRLGADLDVLQSTGCTPIHAASKRGHWQVVRALAAAGANVDLADKHGASPLHSAARHDHLNAVKVLIAAQADVNSSERGQRSPLMIAASRGHQRVVKALISAHAEVDASMLQAAWTNGHRETAELLAKALATDDFCQAVALATDSLPPTRSRNEMIRMSVDYFPEPATPELNRLIHQSLNRAGFTRSRATLQSAAADVLKTIVSRKLSQGSVFLVGSFSEGWGCSLTSLDGQVDADSDIDVMMIPSERRIFHLEGQCTCHLPDSERNKKISNTNGDVSPNNYHLEPTRQVPGSVLRPGMKLHNAYRLCSYPTIAPLETHRVTASQIPRNILHSLQQEVTSRQCHLIEVDSTAESEPSLRVSTTLLERQIIRSLSTVQGQLFVSLKYLVKRVISKQIVGLKTYHAKTVLFRMLNEAPADEWRPENLVYLTRQSLELLANCFESRYDPESSDYSDGLFMKHFFLSDSFLYLKGSNLTDLVQAVNQTIHELPIHLMTFMQSLRALKKAGNFYFHPFLMLPSLDEKPTSLIESAMAKSKAENQYIGIYANVRETLALLAQDDSSSDCRAVLEDLTARLPDCAATTRETLKVLTLLKFEEQEAAKEVLLNNLVRKVKRAISWSEDRLEAEATEDFVWQHLRSGDTALKFCFEFDSVPNLSFLPDQSFPICLPTNADGGIFINFEALWQGLSLLLLPAFASNKLGIDWAENLLERDDADLQELLTCLNWCTDNQLTQRLLSKYGSSFASYLNWETELGRLAPRLADTPKLGVKAPRALH